MEIIAAIVATILLVIDWGQTNYIVSHSDKFHEINPILGEHPSKSAVRKYFIAWIIIVNLAAFLLPIPYGLAVCVIVALVEVWAIVHNRKLGLHFEF